MLTRLSKKRYQNEGLEATMDSVELLQRQLHAQKTKVNLQNADSNVRRPAVRRGGNDLVFPFAWDLVRGRVLLESFVDAPSTSSVPLVLARVLCD